MGNASLNRKVFLILIDDFKTTLSLTCFWQDSNKNENENESENESESDNENDDDNNKNNENENKNEDDDDYEIKQINDYFKMIDESISFEDQINLLKMMDDIKRYSHMSYYDNDKDLNLKFFKLKCAFLSKDLDEMLFVEKFGHAFATLIDKLINTTNKEENRLIVEDIKKNMDKIYEHDGFYNFMIQPEDKCVDLLDAATIILEFNETIQLAGDW